MMAGEGAAWFYVWWITVNGCMQLVSFYFLQRFIQKNCRPLHKAAYVAIGCVITFIIMRFQIHGTIGIILEMALLVFFAVVCLHEGWTKTAIPIIILFTLSACLQGIETIVMRWLVVEITIPALGIFCHILLTFLLVLMQFISLRLIVRKYAFTAKQSISAYLYILLLPCAFIVLAIQSNVRLDNAGITEIPLMGRAGLNALIWVAGALATFFIIINVFSKIVQMSQQETENAIAAEHLQKQKIYIEEAKKRNEHYRSFQHDIHNHLLVLAGLMNEEKYAEARAYSQTLSEASYDLLTQVETGNDVLDVLLREKISYANQNDISVAWEINIPEKLAVDDIDLCIVFSNAIDNAISACIPLKNLNKEIKITARMKHQFLLIELINPTVLKDGYEEGTGLRNMKQIAKKYQGVIEVQNSEGIFRLSVLLCLK